MLNNVDGMAIGCRIVRHPFPFGPGEIEVTKRKARTIADHQIIHPDGRRSTCKSNMLPHWKRQGWRELTNVERFWTEQALIPIVTSGPPLARHFDTQGIQTVFVFIPTCDRLHQIRALIERLQRDDVILHIANDGKRHVSVPKGCRATIWNTQGPNGKMGFWRVVNSGLYEAKRIRWDLFVMIPDDALIEDDFVDDVKRYWTRIRDPRKASLQLLTSATRVPNAKVLQRPPSHDNIFRVGYHDCCFCCERPPLAYIDFDVSAVAGLAPRVASGVGDYMSRRWQEVGNLYQLTEGIVNHDGTAPSRMHPGKEADWRDA